MKALVIKDTTVRKFNIQILFFLLIIYSSDASAADTGIVPEIIWKTHADSSILTTPAVMGDNLVCVTDRNGTVTVLQMDGTMVWQYQTGYEYLSSPVIAQDSTIYVRSQYILTALNADGTLKWEYGSIPQDYFSTEKITDDDNMNSGYWVYSGMYDSPSIGIDGTVYVTIRGTIYAFEPEGSLLWEYSTKNGYELTAASVGPDGTVYFNDQYGTSYALQPDGILKWKFTARNTLWGAPVPDYSGRVYIGSSEGILSLNSDGSFRWFYEMESGIANGGQPVVSDDGTVYTHDSKGIIHAINENGTGIWQYDTELTISYSSPVLGADGLVYAVVSDGRLITLDSEGSLRYESVFGSKSYTSPVITGNGIILIGCDDNVLCALQSDSFGYRENAPWPCWGHDKRHTGRTVLPTHLGTITGSIINSSTNEPVARMSVKADPGEYVGVTDTNGRFILSGLLEDTYDVTAVMFGYLPVTVENIVVGDGQHVEVLLEANHDRKWLKWKMNCEGSLFCTPAIDDNGTIYITNSSGKFFALNPDGTIRWTYEADSHVFTPVIGADGTIYLGCRDRLKMLNSDGTLIRDYQANGNVGIPAVAPDGTVYFGCEDKNLYALSSIGELLWKIETNHGHFSQPAIAYDGTVYFTSGNLLYAADPFGTILWTNAGSSLSPVIDADGTVYIADKDKHFYALNRDGSEKWMFQTNSQYFYPAIGADCTIYFGEDDSITATSSGGKLMWKLEIEGDVRGTPAIGRDGIIYVGGEYNKFYALTNEGYLTWRLDTEGTVSGSPAISPDGVVYFGTDRGYLYAVQTRSYGYEVDAQWPCYGKDNRNSVTQEPPSGVAIIEGKVTSTIDNAVITGVKIKLSPGKYSAITNSRGEYHIIVKDSGTYTTNVSSPGWISQNDKTISVAAGDSVTIDFVLNRDNLWIKWKLQVGSAWDFHTSFKTPAIDEDGTIYIQTAYTFTAVNPDGTVKWKKESDLNVLSSPSIANDGTIIYNDYYQMYSINKDGSNNWSCKLPDASSTSAIGNDGTIFLSNRDSGDRWMRAYTTHGEEKWKFYKIRNICFTSCWD